MFLDYLLLIIGGVLLLTALLLAVMLFRSRKMSLEYRRILQSETERIDLLSTLRETYSANSSEVDKNNVKGPNAPTTEVLTGSFMAEDPIVGGNLDLTPLDGKYRLIREISGGGMSRIFLAENIKLGNEWIVKYIDGHTGGLVEEAEVLKRLNHISLPQIIDIFQNKQGTFLVERYIEGYPLDQALRLRRSIKESLICDWGLQLARVLNYLHNLDTPIIHCDLKPSNIMVTYDNRLVLIDFGISKREGESHAVHGLTYRYAAPEQFQGESSSTEIAKKRFGILPPQQQNWKIDAKTDIYSTGVILYELLTGTIPTYQDTKSIYDHTTRALADVVCKCLELDPANRYQSAQELIEALEHLKNRQVNMARSLVLRRVMAVCCGIALIGGLGSSASALYINRTENLSVISMEYSRVVVTQQQSIQISVEKTTPSGETVTLDPSNIRWSYDQDNVARLDGDQLVGLNVGTTTLYGQYRNKEITLDVEVTEPVKDLVSIALQYPVGAEISLYAGSGERDFLDGQLSDCAFVSPESLSVVNGRIYLSDSGTLRVLEDGQVTSTMISPAYLTADIVRGWRSDIYLKTGPWEDDNGQSYYGIARVSGDNTEILFSTEAAWSVIPDFSFSSDGMLWFIQQNLGTGITALYTLDPATQDVEWVMDLPDGARCMAFDTEDTLYISVPEDGIILRVAKGADNWTYFAGLEENRNFVDGEIANFYRPTALAAGDGFLYVLDFDTVRRITIDGGVAALTETLVGIPTEESNPAVSLGEGGEAVLSASELASIALDGERVLLTDPKNSVIYEIK